MRHGVVCGATLTNIAIRATASVQSAEFKMVNNPMSSPFFHYNSRFDAQEMIRRFHLEGLFRQSYGYRSGINESIQAHLSEIACDISGRISLRDGDGTTPSFHKNTKLVRVFPLPEVEIVSSN